MRLQLPEILNLDTMGEVVQQANDMLNHPQGNSLTIDFGKLKHLEMSGMGLFLKLMEQCKALGIQMQFENINDEFTHLMNFINLEQLTKQQATKPKRRTFLEKLGRDTLFIMRDLGDFLAFLGQSTTELLRELLNPIKRVRWWDTFYYIETAGLNAVPIVGLIAFLIGLIISFQSAGLLQQYGANIFVVDMVALSMTRELAPLITSILIAGRSGSSFTAEIGTMKVSEEVDAMKIIGLDLTEYLVAPKFWAMVVSLPLLAFWADFMGLLGGAIIANSVLDISFYSFILRLKETLDVRHVIIGLAKCVFFGGIISLVGCYRGFLVTSGAGSVGRQTTNSVVTSIFFVIIADAGFSVIFTYLGI